MKVGECAIDADQQSPPDQGADPTYPDAEPLDFGCRFIGRDLGRRA